MSEQLPKLKTVRGTQMQRAAAYAAHYWWAIVRERFPKDPPEDRRDHFARAAVRAGRISRGEPVIRRPIDGLCNSTPDGMDPLQIEMCDLPKGHASYCKTRGDGHMWWPR